MGTVSSSCLPREETSGTAAEATQKRKQQRLPRAFAKVLKASRGWKLENIKNARARFAESYAETGSFLIGRRQFWEIFTDYDLALVQHGQFLSLPLEVFAIFEQEKTGIVDIREILCLLALMSAGQTLSAKLEVSFPLFGPTMTEERVAQLLGVLQRALFRVGVLQDKASPTAVTSLAARICGEGAWRRCQTVSAQLIGDWLANCAELSDIVGVVVDSKTATDSKKYSLLRDKTEVKQTGTVMKREARKLLNATMSTPNLRGAGRKTKKRETTRASAAAGRATVSNNQSNTELDSNAGASPTNKEAAGIAANALAPAAARHAKPMESEVVASAIQKFPQEDLKVLQDAWKQATSSSKGVSKDQFASLMNNQFPSISSPNVLSRMFAVFDRNKDGFLCWDEFIVGVSRMAAGELQEKVRFLFDVANSNPKTGATSKIAAGHEEDTNSADTEQPATSSGEQSMKLVDLVKLVQDTNNEMMECAHFVELIITMMDADKNGSVERHEFERAVSEIPAILDSFDECLRPSEDLQRWVRRLQRAIPAFSAENVVNRWVSLGPQKETHKTVDWEGFVNFVEPIWEGSGVSPKHQMLKRGESTFNFDTASQNALQVQPQGPADDVVYSLLLNLYRVAFLNGQEQAQIDLRKLIVGIVLSLQTPLEQTCPNFLQLKGKLYFELFDSDCSESVDYQEFFEMLYTAQLDMQDAGWKTVETLRSLDINKDGQISFSEFMEAVNSDKSILHYFGRIFHASTLEDSLDDETSGEGIEEETKAQNQVDEKPSTTKTPPSKLAISLQTTSSHLTASAPVLPMNNVYRTTYHFARKEPSKPPPSVAERKPSVRSNFGSDPASPKSPKAPIPSARSALTRSPTSRNGGMRLQPLSN